MAYSYVQTDWPILHLYNSISFVIIESLVLFVIIYWFVLANILYFSQSLLSGTVGP